MSQEQPSPKDVFNFTMRACFHALEEKGGKGQPSLSMDEHREMSEQVWSVIKQVASGQLTISVFTRDDFLDGFDADVAKELRSTVEARKGPSIAADKQLAAHLLTMKG